MISPNQLTSKPVIQHSTANAERLRGRRRTPGSVAQGQAGGEFGSMACEMFPSSHHAVDSPAMDGRRRSTRRDHDGPTTTKRTVRATRRSPNTRWRSAGGAHACTTWALRRGHIWFQVGDLWRMFLFLATGVSTAVRALAEFPASTDTSASHNPSRRRPHPSAHG